MPDILACGAVSAGAPMTHRVTTLQSAPTAERSSGAPSLCVSRLTLGPGQACSCTALFQRRTQPPLAHVQETIGPGLPTIFIYIIDKYRYIG